MVSEGHQKDNPDMAVHPKYTQERVKVKGGRVKNDGLPGRATP